MYVWTNFSTWTRKMRKLSTAEFSFSSKSSFRSFSKKPHKQFLLNKNCIIGIGGRQFGRWMRFFIYRFRCNYYFNLKYGNGKIPTIDDKFRCTHNRISDSIPAVISTFNISDWRVRAQIHYVNGSHLITECQMHATIVSGSRLLARHSNQRSSNYIRNTTPCQVVRPNHRTHKSQFSGKWFMLPCDSFHSLFGLVLHFNAFVAKRIFAITAIATAPWLFPPNS